MQSFQISTTSIGEPSLGPSNDNFIFTFNGFCVAIPSYARLWSSDACTAAFAALPMFKSVSCTQGNFDIKGGASYTVVINSFSPKSYDNNIYWNNGSSSSWNMSCIASQVAPGNGFCKVTDLSVSPSNRGKDGRFLALQFRALIIDILNAF